jgi:hypothetical protein
MIELKNVSNNKLDLSSDKSYSQFQHIDSNKQNKPNSFTKILEKDQINYMNLNRKRFYYENFLKNKNVYKQTVISPTFDFEYLFHIRRIICNFGGRKNHEYTSYFKLKKYLDTRKTIEYYFKNLRNSDMIRTILLNPYQNLSLDYLRLPNITSDSNLEEMDIYLNRNEDENFNELIDYYKRRIESDTMDDYDTLLLNYSRKDLKNYVADIK